MAVQKTSISTEYGRRVSWGALICGFFVTVALQVTLALLGAGFGLAISSPYTANTGSATGFAVGAGIWLLITMIISGFVGGWVAGHLRGYSTGGAFHGFGTWALTTVLSMLLVTALIGGAGLAGAAALGPMVSNQIMPGNTDLGQPQVGQKAMPGSSGLSSPNQPNTGPLVRDEVTTARHMAAGTAFWGFFALLLAGLASIWGGAIGSGGNRRTEMGIYQPQEEERRAA